MKSKSARVTAWMTFCLSIMALTAALVSIMNPNIYQDLVASGLLSPRLVYGALIQDYVTIIFALLLAVLSLVFIKKPSYKPFIVMLGLVACIFYNYGLYVIQAMYTSIYILYMLTFSLSIFSLIWGISSFKALEVNQYTLPRLTRKAIGIYLLVITILFTMLWLMMLIPYSIKHLKPDIYGVFILDLCIIMPTFGIIASQLLRQRPFGNILAGIALVNSVALIVSVALAEIIVPPLVGGAPDYGMVAIYSTIVIISLLLSIIYLFTLKKASANPN